MNRSIALLLPLLLAPSGCIIYENNGDQHFGAGDWWNDDGAFDTASPSEGHGPRAVSRAARQRGRRL